MHKSMRIYISCKDKNAGANLGRKEQASSSVGLLLNKRANLSTMLGHADFYINVHEGAYATPYHPICIHSHLSSQRSNTNVT